VIHVLAAGYFAGAALVFAGALSAWAQHRRRRREDAIGGMLEVLPGPGLTVVPEPRRPFDWQVDCDDWFAA
jgi:hypothetical protein